MKLALTTELKSLENVVLLQEDGKTPITLSTVIGNALLATFQDEVNLSGEDKVKRFRLAEAAVLRNGYDFTIEDVALIKKLVAKAYGPLVVGRVFQILDPPAAS
jgi:hypothetical protein